MVTLSRKHLNYLLNFKLSASKSDNFIEQLQQSQRVLKLHAAASLSWLLCMVGAYQKALGVLLKGEICFHANGFQLA